MRLKLARRIIIVVSMTLRERGQNPGSTAVEQELATSHITFRRHLPKKVLDAKECFREYPDYVQKGPEYVATNLGTSKLYEADPKDSSDRYVAGNLAVSLVHQTGKKPDIIIAVTSHLPSPDDNNPNAQRVAVNIRSRLAKWDLAENQATAQNSKTVSAACTGFVVALDWLRQQNPKGANVLVIVDETGYRQTLPPPLEDQGKAGLLFSDAAVAFQGQYGQDFEVLASEIFPLPQHSDLLHMRVPLYDSSDPFLLVHPVPYHKYFSMNGPRLRRIFEREITNEKVHALMEQAGLLQEDLAFAASHQASKPMVAHTYELFPDVPYRPQGIGIYGNTSSASIPLDIQDGIEQGAIKAGNKGFLLAFGAGLLWGGAVLRIGKN